MVAVQGRFRWSFPCMCCIMKVCLLVLVTCMFTESVASLPELWHESPSSLDHYPVINGSTVINPWEYRQRLGLYRIILNKTAKSFARFGTDNNENILWGLALQHGWQFKTGRLPDFSRQSECGLVARKWTCISHRSWWAAMNYYLSVIPFLAALKAGTLDPITHPVQILKPGPEDLQNVLAFKYARFCTTVDECRTVSPRMMEDWIDFFKFINNRQSEHDMLEIVKTSHTLVDTKDAMIASMWTAHVSSLAAGESAFKELLPFMTAEEASFGSSWAAVVEFIAATRYDTNYNNTNTYQEKFLPKRTLKQGDAAPNISDFTELENRALYFMEHLAKMNRESGVSVLAWWKRAMCSSAGRAEGRYLLEVGITTPSSIPGSLLRLTWIMATQPCDTFHLK